MGSKKKSVGKTLLITGLVLLGVAGAALIGLGVTGSLLFVRDFLAVALITGAAAGVGIPAGKGIASVFSRASGKNKGSKTLVREYDREREIEREEEKIMSMGSLNQSTSKYKVDNKNIVSNQEKQTKQKKL